MGKENIKFNDYDGECNYLINYQIGWCDLFKLSKNGETGVKNIKNEAIIELKNTIHNSLETLRNNKSVKIMDTNVGGDFECKREIKTIDEFKELMNKFMEIHFYSDEKLKNKFKKVIDEE